tara:strand:+ start:35 stop:214 length:180 start_codon:yes stop_codon:yes gene_type:complete
MIEETKKQLTELKTALDVVTLWMDKKEGDDLIERTVSEFLRIKTLHFRDSLYNEFQKEI